MTEKKAAFVVPNGAQIQITEAGAELSYDGDIELHGDLGFPIHRLKSHQWQYHLTLQRLYS